METNNQDQVKDLQYFLNKKAKENGYSSWNIYCSYGPGNFEEKQANARKAKDEYISHLEKEVQQAGFTLEDIKTAMIHASCMRGRLSDIQEQQIPAYISSLNKTHVSDLVQQAKDAAFKEGRDAQFAKCKPFMQGYQSHFVRPVDSPYEEIKTRIDLPIKDKMKVHIEEVRKIHPKARIVYWIGNDNNFFYQVRVSDSPGFESLLSESKPYDFEAWENAYKRLYTTGEKGGDE